MINKKELKYIIYSVIFVALWFLFALPFLIEKFDGSNLLLEFTLFNVGLILFFQIFLKAAVLNMSTRIKSSIGLTLVFISLDTISPPYVILSSGELISQGPLLLRSSSDYIIGTFVKSIGLDGFLIYIGTYIIFPIILLSIAAFLLPNFVRKL